MTTLAVLLGLVLAFALVFAVVAAFLQRRSKRRQDESLTPELVSVSAFARFVLRRRQRPVYVWTAEVGRGSLRLLTSTGPPPSVKVFEEAFADEDVQIMVEKGVSLPDLRVGVRLLPRPQLVAFNPNAGGLPAL